MRKIFLITMCVAVFNIYALFQPRGLRADECPSNHSDGHVVLEEVSSETENKTKYPRFQERCESLEKSCKAAEEYAEKKDNKIYVFFRDMTCEDYSQICLNKNYIDIIYDK